MDWLAVEIEKNSSFSTEIAAGAMQPPIASWLIIELIICYPFRPHHGSYFQRKLFQIHTKLYALPNYQAWMLEDFIHITTQI